MVRAKADVLLPVPVLDEPFNLALIGTKGKWYDHEVIVSNPEKLG